MKYFILWVIILISSSNIHADYFNSMPKEQEFNLDKALETNPYSYNGYINNLYSCQKKVEGCSQQEQAKIDEYEISEKAITSRDFSSLIKSSSVGFERGYFIPLSLSEKELLLLAAGTSLGLVVFNQDQELMDFIQEHKTETTDRIATVGNLLGREAIMPIALGSYFMGVVLKNGKLKEVGLFTVTAGLATQIVATAFKEGFHRMRPNENEGPYRFFEPGNKSFFSGHSSAAFSLATVIAMTFKEKKWVPYVAYGLATITAYARMHDHKHWASDVLAGAIMGTLITRATIRMINRDSSEGGLMVYPSFNPANGDFMIYIEYSGKKHPRELKCASMPDGPSKIEACIEEATSF